MRLTVPLGKEPIRWLLKKKWLAKGKFYKYPYRIPEAVKARGAEVVDAAEEYKPKPWEPLEPFETPNHPLYDPEPKPEDHPDYNEQIIYDFGENSKLLEGERQALVLTKSQPFYSLPEKVLSLVGQVKIPDQDELVQRYIMQANRWDPTKEVLPTRVDPSIAGWKFKKEVGVPYDKRTTILLRRLVRLFLATGGWYPDLLSDREVNNDQYLRVQYALKDKPIQIESVLELMVTSRRPLAPFTEDEETVDASTQHALPDLYPVLPTIDLQKIHIYKHGDHSGFLGNTEPREPHTIFVNYRDKWETSQRNAKLLMFLFATATRAARRRFGEDVRRLPEPVCVQGVGSDGVNFQLACFQLNTLELASQEGIKNLVWFNGMQPLYERLEPKRAMLRHTEYHNYDPSLLQKLLALYVNGAQLGSPEMKDPTTDTDTYHVAQARS